MTYQWMLELTYFRCKSVLYTSCTLVQTDRKLFCRHSSPIFIIFLFPFSICFFPYVCTCVHCNNTLPNSRSSKNFTFFSSICNLQPPCVCLSLVPLNTRDVDVSSYERQKKTRNVLKKIGKYFIKLGVVNALIFQATSCPYQQTNITSTKKSSSKKIPQKHTKFRLIKKKERKIYHPNHSLSISHAWNSFLFYSNTREHKGFVSILTISQHSFHIIIHVKWTGMEKYMWIHFSIVD